MSDIELIKCNKCDGFGRIELGERNEDYSIFWHLCSKCGGRGEVDWIENIVVEENRIYGEILEHYFRDKP